MAQHSLPRLVQIWSWYHGDIRPILASSNGSILETNIGSVLGIIGYQYWDPILVLTRSWYRPEYRPILASNIGPILEYRNPILDQYWTNIDVFVGYLRLINQKLPTGFEPADKSPKERKVRRLDHSAIVTCKLRDLQIDIFSKSHIAVSICVSVCLCVC